VYLTRFRTYKIALPPQTKNLGGEGASARYPHAAKSLYRSIFKKSRHLGFGVYKVIWSMLYSIKWLHFTRGPLDQYILPAVIRHVVIFCARRPYK
jgi:hypothetical protein